METESLLFSIVIIILLALNTYLIYKNKKIFHVQHVIVLNVMLQLYATYLLIKHL